MQNELNALEANQTWQVTNLSYGKMAIGCKWVYIVKYLLDGSVDKYKARLVAKGYNQLLGLDYTESFSPVAKLVIVRILLVIIAIKEWPLHQLDINNAYLYSHINEELYMELPEGYTK